MSWNEARKKKDKKTSSERKDITGGCADADSLKKLFAVGTSAARRSGIDSSAPGHFVHEWVVGLILWIPLVQLSMLNNAKYFVVNVKMAVFLLVLGSSPTNPLDAGEVNDVLYDTLFPLWNQWVVNNHYYLLETHLH